MKEKIRLDKKTKALLFFSALCSALPLSVPSLHLFSWFSFAPFFLVFFMEKEGGKLALSLQKGLFFGFFYHFFVYFWFVWLYPLSFAGLSGPASVVVILLAWPGISFLHGLLFILPALFYHFGAKRVKNRLFLAGFIIFGILLAQRLQGMSEIAFPWVRVSLGQYRATALIQSASLIGQEGLDLLMLSVSALTALFFVSEKKNRFLFLFSAASLFLVNLSVGLVFLSRDGKKGEEITASLVQGCILSGEKWSSAGTALETYTSLTKEHASSETDLFVWPESAVPVNLSTNSSLAEQYRELVSSVGAPLFTGAFSQGEIGTQNSAVLVTENGFSSPYSKRILVPFGERMPYRALLSAICPPLTQINMLSEDLEAGKDSALIDFNGEKLGGIICFESIFPSVVRESVSDGASLLILVTNDSWYEDSPAVFQHLAHAVFRSVENARSTLRCANSGVSAFIDEKGRILSELGPLKQGVLTDTVTFSDETTLYTVTGDCVFPVFGLILFSFFAFCFLKERRERNG